MFNGRGMLLLLVAVAALVEVCFTCYPNQASGCAHYGLLSTVKVIPLPNPTRLDENCRELGDGLNCLLRGSVFGNCDSQKHPRKQVYITMQQVIDIPCRTAKEDYQSGSACLKSEPSSPLRLTMSACYARNSRLIKTRYCEGMDGFLACVSTEIMKIDGCNSTHRDIIHAMIATYMNGVADMMSCEKIDVPSLEKTTTTTTTTTTTRPKAVSSSPQKPVVVAFTTKRAEAEVTKTTEAPSHGSRTTTVNPAYRVAKSQPSAGHRNMALFVMHAVAMLATVAMYAW